MFHKFLQYVCPQHTHAEFQLNDAATVLIIVIVTAQFPSGSLDICTDS